MARSGRCSWGAACCLCLALLCASVQWSAAADPPSSKDGAKPTAGSSKPAASSSSSKTSSIIPSAGETKLVNGIGDVQPDGACRATPNSSTEAVAHGFCHCSAAGACKADVKALCKDVSPGDDRLLLCLVKRMKQTQQGNIAGVLCCPCNASSTALGRTWMSLVAAGAAVHSHIHVRVRVSGVQAGECRRSVSRMLQSTR